MREDVELGVLVRRQDFFHLRFLCDGGVVAHLHLFTDVGSGVDPLPIAVVGDNNDIAIVVLKDDLCRLGSELPDVPVPPGHLGSSLLEQALDCRQQTLRHIDEGFYDIETVEDELRLELDLHNPIAFGGRAPFIGLRLFLTEVFDAEMISSHAGDIADDDLGLDVAELKTDLWQ